MKSGIYIIVNTTNSKEYIGSSKDIKGRWYAHRYSLRRRNHTNKHLQNAWNKDGESSFEFEILEYCEIDNLKDREDWWIVLLDSRNPNKGYNKWSADRHKVSDETRMKNSESQKRIGNKPPSWKGKTHSEESRRQMSIIRKTYLEHNKQWNKGRVGCFSEETRLKMSTAQIGKKMSEETKSKLSIMKKGKPWSKARRAAQDHKVR